MNNSSHKSKNRSIMERSEAGSVSNLGYRKGNLLSIPLRAGERSTSSIEIREELKRRRKMVSDVRIGVQKQLIAWSRVKARRESDRIQRHERSIVPSVYHGPNVCKKGQNRKSMPVLETV